MVALGIETTNLHRRVALNFLKIIGTSVRKLMLGFMLVTWLLSMARYRISIWTISYGLYYMNVKKLAKTNLIKIAKIIILYSTLSQGSYA